MTASISEVEAFLASPEYAELDRRLESEQLTAEQCAKIVGLPFEVFRDLWAGVMAWDTVKQTLGTEH
jgi:hypothetical protein